MEKTDNEIIAEFMGIGYDPEYHNGDKYIGEAVDKDGDNDWYSPRYTTSWDWLMPVVEEIGGMWSPDHSELSMQAQHICEMPLNSHIQQVYREVVEFIKWYQNQPK
jgi:hypothetical protein